MWIEGLDWPVVQDFQPWILEKQVAGYTKKFDGLDFYSVHGVGHMVPQYARERSQIIMNEFMGF